MTRRLTVAEESWTFDRPFAISRGSRTEAHVVVAEIRDGDHRGRGECVPYPRYGETVGGVADLIRSLENDIAGGISRAELATVLPAGAARNALDCALWDLEAKQVGKRVWEMVGLRPPKPAVTAETIALGAVDDMRQQAERLHDSQLLKVKLDAADVTARLQAVRQGAPDARLIIDPNEAWDVALLAEILPELARLGVELVEQPVPAGDDEGLADIDPPIPLCADEACHTRSDLDRLRGRYQTVNIKLDKAGGLSTALDLARAADAAGFGIMVGCMVGTSLAMAPATLLSSFAEFVDLDGPLFLKEDRVPGLVYAGGRVHPPEPELWG